MPTSDIHDCFAGLWAWEWVGYIARLVMPLVCLFVRLLSDNWLLYRVIEDRSQQVWQ
jgi:hypothetical protein